MYILSKQTRSWLRPRSHYAGVIRDQNTSNVFCPHYAGEIWKRNNHRSFWICIWRKLGQGIHIAPFSKCSPAFSNSPGLESVFKESRFRLGLMRTVGQTARAKLPFHISSAKWGRSLSRKFSRYFRTLYKQARGHAPDYSATLTSLYYMASSVSGQDESNPALWLATQAGKMELSCPLGTTRRVPQEKFPRKPYNKSFIHQACSVKMAGYWPRSFFANLWTSTPSRSINTQKKNLANIQPSWPHTWSITRTYSLPLYYVVWTENIWCVLRVKTSFSENLSGLVWKESKGLLIWARTSGLARFPRSRLAILSFVKISMCSYEKPGWPGYRDLGFCDRYLGNRDENFCIWTLQPG